MASVRSARDPPDRALLMTSYIVLKHISMKHENRKVGINNCMKTENLNIYHSWKWSQHGFTDRSNKGPVENPLDGYDVYVLCSIVCFCFCQPYIMILCVFPGLYFCCTFSCYLLMRVSDVYCTLLAHHAIKAAFHRNGSWMKSAKSFVVWVSVVLSSFALAVVSRSFRRPWA